MSDPTNIGRVIFQWTIKTLFSYLPVASTDKIKVMDDKVANKPNSEGVKIHLELGIKAKGILVQC